LVNPDDVRVEQVTFTDKIGYLRRVLRLHHLGEPVGDFRTGRTDGSQQTGPFAALLGSDSTGTCRRGALGRPSGPAS
jgi:hypothetical protein